MSRMAMTVGVLSLEHGSHGEAAVDAVDSLSQKIRHRKYRYSPVSLFLGHGDSVGHHYFMYIAARYV